MTRIRAASALAAAALVWGGCGGSEPEQARERNAEDTSFLKAIATAADERDPETKGPPADELNCWAEAMVDRVPAETLTKAGMDPEKLVQGQVRLGEDALSDDEADAVVDGFVDCIDLKAVLMPTEADNAAEGVADCMEKLDWDALERPFVEGMILTPEDEQASAEAMAPFNECIMGSASKEGSGAGAPTDSAPTDSAPEVPAPEDSVAEPGG